MCRLWYFCHDVFDHAMNFYDRHVVMTLRHYSFPLHDDYAPSGNDSNPEPMNAAAANAIHVGFVPTAVDDVGLPLNKK